MCVAANEVVRAKRDDTVLAAVQMFDCCVTSDDIMICQDHEKVDSI
jgi:hypothetical protein